MQRWAGSSFCLRERARMHYSLRGGYAVVAALMLSGTVWVSANADAGSPGHHLRLNGLLLHTAVIARQLLLYCVL